MNASGSRFARRGRLIVVDGMLWRWRCGKQHVIAYSDKGERRCIGAHTLRGLSPDDFERGQHKQTSDGMIRPSDVAKWLVSK